MNTSVDWEKPIQRLERLMRLRSFPVAFKLLEDKSKLSEIPFIRRMQHKSTLCQMINLVRNFDWKEERLMRLEILRAIGQSRELSNRNMKAKPLCPRK